MLTENNTRHRKLEQGQSLVELAIGMLVLSIIIMGLVDLGRLYFVYVALEDSAGEAALYLSLNPRCVTPDSGSQCANPNNALYRAQHAAGGNFDWTEDTTIDPQIPAAWGAGTVVTVEIHHDHQILFPFITQIAGLDHITITGKATQTILSE